MLSERTRWRVDFVVTIAMILTTGLLMYANWPRLFPRARSIEPPSELISIADAPTYGNPDAEWVLIEYSDYQCPFCARFERDTRPEIDNVYIRSGRLLLAFRHLPIETLHSFAGTAAAAATCASEQGRFWEYHELLFSNSRTLDETRLFAFADQVGLAQRSFEACLHTRGPEKVQRDLEEARRLGLTGTPAFLLGRIQANRLVTVVSVISGSLPFREFQERIDDVLNPRVSSW